MLNETMISTKIYAVFFVILISQADAGGLLAVTATTAVGGGCTAICTTTYTIAVLACVGTGPMAGMCIGIASAAYTLCMKNCAIATATTAMYSALAPTL